jgi:hypothetical protein
MSLLPPTEREGRKGKGREGKEMNLRKEARQPV